MEDDVSKNIWVAQTDIEGFFFFKEGHNVGWVRKEKESEKIGGGKYGKNMLYKTTKELI